MLRVESEGSSDNTILSVVNDVSRQRLQSSLSRIHTVYPEQAPSYIESLTTVYDNVPYLSWMLPEDSVELGVAATRELIATSAEEGVESHLANGERTDGSIRLRGGWRLPYQAAGAEPLMYYDDWNLAFFMAGEIEHNPNLLPICIRSENGKRVYRFIDTSGALPPCSAFQVRERGSLDYDPAVDYGRPGYGVEASFSLSTDTDILQRALMHGGKPQLLAVGKDPAANNKVINLRIDREAGTQGDPNRQAIDPNGFISLDHGALRNVQKGGRSAALGGFLALAAQRRDPDSTLNHLPVFEDRYGDADVFADLARGVEAKITSKGQLDVSDIKKLRTRLRRADRRPSRGFPAFELGDNPYDIGGGAVRKLAHFSGVELAAEPSGAEIQELFNAWGKEAVFRTNIDTFALASRGLSMSALVRQLEKTDIIGSIKARTVDGLSDVKNYDHGLLFEGTAAWMSNRAAYLQKLVEQGGKLGAVILAATDRLLDTPTEVGNPQVIALRKTLGRVPTAYDFMSHTITSQLTAAKIAIAGVVQLPHYLPESTGMMRRTSTGDLASTVIGEYGDAISSGNIINALNAPAGAMFLGPLKAFQEELPTFDVRSQFYFGSNGGVLAQNDRHVIAAAGFQNPYTAPSALARWVKTVHELNSMFATP